MPANSLPNMMLTQTQLCTYALCSCALCLPLSTTVESALQIHLFLTNKANFRKSQMNITDYITMDYAKWTLGQRGKNKANSNPIKANSNPIIANKMPKQTQYKAKQTQFQEQKMLLRMTINTRRQSLGYYNDRRLYAGQIPSRRHEFLAANYEVKLDSYINDVYNAGFI